MFLKLFLNTEFLNATIKNVSVLYWRNIIKSILQDSTALKRLNNQNIFYGTI